MENLIFAYDCRNEVELVSFSGSLGPCRVPVAFVFGVCPVAALLAVFVRQQARGVEQLVVGHEPLLSCASVSLPGAQPGAPASSVCRVQRPQDPHGPRVDGAQLVHEDGTAKSGEVSEVIYIYPIKRQEFKLPPPHPSIGPFPG